MARILVVDDERSIRRTLSQFLRDAGHEVAEAEDAIVASQFLGQAEFDVVVTDIILPQINGVELLRQIHASAPHVHVLMMTGEPTVETASEAIRAGAADYLFKPINKDTILRAVASAARIKSLEDARRALEAENLAHRENLEQLVAERTRQLQASEDLARQLSHFNQAALDALTAHICVLDAQGTIVAVNRAWAAFAAANPSINASLPPTTGVGANYFDVCDRATGEDAELARTAVDNLRAVARGDIAEFTLEYPCHSPAIRRWFVMHATRFAHPGPVHIVVAHENIASRKLAEERLREQAALLDAANDAIVVHDLEGTVLYWNHAAEQLYHWTSAEAIGRPLSSLFAQDPKTIEPARAALLEQGSWSGELQQTTRKGRFLTVFARWTLLHNDPRRPAKILTITSDITEQRLLEAQFLRAQRLEGVGALASGIAHDLNNILAPVLMTAAMLRDNIHDPESRAMLDTVENCAQRGADIIKQLLTFARGKPTARVPLPVRHLLRDLEKLIRETFPRDIQPKVETSEDLWPLLGDVTQVHQALMNLCVNARDAMPDGGTLTLTASNRTVDAAFAAMVPNAKTGCHVCVAVSDTGTGIAPNALEHIFDPFFTTKEVGRGTGLGLATVLGIVRGHEGFVLVNSQPGVGTTFELFFPASPKPQPPSPAPPNQPPPQGHQELILVVDDELSIRECLRITLEARGYRVVTASNGAEGLAAFTLHRDQIRLVLTDMMMPVMNGPAMINALRALDPLLPILGMTGLPEKSGVKGLEQVELCELLTKPFSGSDLLSSLHRLLHPTNPIPGSSQ